VLNTRQKVSNTLDRIATLVKAFELEILSVGIGGIDTHNGLILVSFKQGPRSSSMIRVVKWPHEDYLARDSYGGSLCSPHPLNAYELY